MTGQEPQPSGRLDLDDIVDLAELIEIVIGRSLRPEESSKLKSAYQAVAPAGATVKSLRASLRHLARRQ